MIIFIQNVTGVSFRLRCYKSSDFAHVMKETKELKLVEEQEATRSNKSIEIRELYGVSAKTNPFFKLVGLKYVIFNVWLFTTLKLVL